MALSRGNGALLPGMLDRNECDFAYFFSFIDLLLTIIVVNMLCLEDLFTK